MDFTYTEDQIALRRAVREFAQSYLAPKAEEIDVNNRFPIETVKALGEQDLMGLAYPEELGGAGYDGISEAIAMEEISAACASTGSIITGHYLGFDALYLQGNEMQKERWLRPALEGEQYAAFCLTEPAGGSDMTSNKTTAVEDGDSYVLNGVKHFITGGAYADFLACFAMTDRSLGKKGMTCFIVEKGTPGMEIASEDNKMGIRGARTAEIVFKDCRVPRENIVGAVGGGYKLALDVIDRGRIGIAAM
ncbi:MAG: acyl-CoA dehydrogenase family protein, partial [Bacillota bacterium]